jgi:hypothetical protein
MEEEKVVVYPEVNVIVSLVEDAKWVTKVF